MIPVKPVARSSVSSRKAWPKRWGWPAHPSACTIKANGCQAAKGATWNAQKQALGGWTLNVHHAYDPASNALYLGDGTRRGIDALGAISLVGGKYRIPAEDGSEIYEFNTAGQHLRTLDALTNAVRLRLYYTQGPAYGHLRPRRQHHPNRAGRQRRPTRRWRRSTIAHAGPAPAFSARSPIRPACPMPSSCAGGLLTTFTNPLGAAATTSKTASVICSPPPFPRAPPGLTRTDTAQAHKSSLATPLAAPPPMRSTTAGEQETHRDRDRRLEQDAADAERHTTNTFPDGSRSSQVAVEDPRWGRPVRLPQRQTTTCPADCVHHHRHAPGEAGDLADPLSLVSQPTGRP